MLQKLKHVKLSTFITTMAIFSFIFIASLGVVGYTNMKKMNENTTVMYEKGTLPLTETISLRAMFLNMRVNFANALNEYDDKTKETMDKYSGYLTGSIDRLISFGVSDEESEILTKIDDAGKNILINGKKHLLI
jgi:methyl-accepting chemotaxis protein